MRRKNLGSDGTGKLVVNALLPKEQITATEEILKQAAAAAKASEAASLAYITLRNRAEKLSLAARIDLLLADSPLIAQAQQLN